MPIVKTGLKLNLSKILCMSSLSASLMKIQSEMKFLSAQQYFLSIICLWEPERAGNSHASRLIWFKIELVQDLMPIFIISKFDEELIKNKVVMAWTFSPLYVYGTFW